MATQGLDSLASLQSKRVDWYDIVQRQHQTQKKKNRIALLKVHADDGMMESITQVITDRVMILEGFERNLLCRYLTHTTVCLALMPMGTELDSSPASWVGGAENVYTFVQWSQIHKMNS